MLDTQLAFSWPETAGRTDANEFHRGGAERGRGGRGARVQEALRPTNGGRSGRRATFAENRRIVQSRST